MRFVAALTLAVLSASVVFAADSGTFPTLKGRTLAGTDRSTEGLRGKPHLVVIGFDRGHGRTLRRWAEGFREAHLDPERADYLEIAAISGVPSFIRGYITKQMTRDVPDAERGKVLVTFSADELCKKLEIKDRKQVQVYLLNSQGTIVDRAQGEFNGEVIKRFQTRLHGSESQGK